MPCGKFVEEKECMISLSLSLGSQDDVEMFCEQKMGEEEETMVGKWAVIAIYAQQTASTASSEDPRDCLERMTREWIRHLAYSSSYVASDALMTDSRMTFDEDPRLISMRTPLPTRLNSPIKS